MFEESQVLSDVWRLEGRWSEALTLLHGLQPVAAQLGDAALARNALLVARVLIDQAMFGGRDTLDEREAALRLALTHAEAAGDASLMGGVWDTWGFSLHAAYLDGDRASEPEHELEYFERGLALRQQSDESREIAESKFHLGLVYGVVRGDHTQARPYFEEAYRLAQAAGDDVMASYAIRHIAFARAADGDMERARADLEESLRLREAARFEPGVAMALIALASVLVQQGDKAKALSMLKRARSILEKLGATRRVETVDQYIAQLG
jgi:tetratricopeptide (TPR) repeat protein